MEFQYDRTQSFWYKRHKLSNGQFCMIGFFKDYQNFDTVENYSVCFAVADKKKQLRNFFYGEDSALDTTLKSTGKCGAEALVWAKNAILAFEEVLKDRNTNHTINILVAGEDSKRFRIYERGLSRYGYKKVPGVGKDDWPWYMKKTIIDGRK